MPGKMPVPARQGLRRCFARRLMASAAVFALVVSCAPLAYVPGVFEHRAAEATLAERSEVTLPKALPRRHFLGSLGLVGLSSQGLPAFAEEEKKKTPPTALEVTGRKGSYDDINGRWSILFGQSINKRAVYKKDGQSYYLIFNDCGNFMMSDKLSGECNGFGTSVKNVWTIDGKPAPTVKVKPVTKESTPEPEPGMSKQEMEDKAQQLQDSLKDAMNKEMEKIDREFSVDTFRGKLDEDEEVVGDRLMAKMNAKIAKGF